MQAWHALNSITNKSPSKSIKFDKKIGLANHVIPKPHSKFSQLSNKRKYAGPTTHIKSNIVLPKFADKRNTSQHMFPIRRRKAMLKLPIRNNIQRPKVPIRRQTTASTSTSLFRVTHDF